MKALDIKAVNDLQIKVENVALILKKIRADGCTIERGPLIMFQSTLNSMLCEALLLQQLILAGEFRMEDQNG